MKNRSPKSEFVRGLYTGLIVAIAGPLLGLTELLKGETPAFALKLAAITSTYAIIFGLALGAGGTIYTWLWGKFIAKKTK
jgi:hypothetical protein